MSTEIQSLKERAVSFLQLVVSGEVRIAYERYVGSDFRHHNPFFPGDADSLMLAMEEDATQNPHKILEVKLAIQENDTVSVLSHLKLITDDPGVALVHIFRFQDNQIVELWDINQSVPDPSPNKNGMF
ncbi:nuclear transport factor 2 family protein [Fredinandcohnia sp. 179-A 10B2 NHS]|uniref:nuclear transport factor 2 family protein n=1 Tax=Fredinandcohnia sp. 179-A 10B2 NHS TaxID=3235176 RepID=UPI0039A0C49F